MGVGLLSAPGSRRIPAVTWDAAAVARRLAAEALASAEGVTSRARAEADAIRSEAYAAGREEGLASASELLARAALRRDAVFAESEGELVDLAFEVARRVLERVAERDRELVLDVARRALDAARRRREVAVRANPADAAALREAEPELVRRLALCPRIAFLEDPAVARGGVVVETEAGAIDARLGPQVDALRRAVLGDATEQAP